METWKGVGCDLIILGMLAKEELIVRVCTLGVLFDLDYRSGLSGCAGAALR